MSAPTSTPVCVLNSGALCGESPVWDARRQVLHWVDIPRETVHSFDPTTGRNTTVQLRLFVTPV